MTRTLRGEVDLGFVVYLTNRCNLACRYCSVYASPTVAAHQLDTLRFEQWMEAFAAVGPNAMQVMLHGGEPLVANPPVEVYARILGDTMARHPHVAFGPTVVCSNGLLLTDKRVDSLTRSGVGHLCVSVDGPEEIHDRNRISGNERGSHARAIARVRGLHRAGRTPGLIAVATEHGDVLAALDYFLSEGFPFFRIKPVGPSGRGGQFYDDGADAFLETMAHEYLEAAERLARHNRDHEPAYETMLASILAFLDEGEAPARDDGVDSVNWTFMIYHGDLYAHPRAHEVPSLRLTHGETPTPRLAAKILNILDESNRLHDHRERPERIREARRRLFQPCPGCPDFEKCASMPPNPMPWVPEGVPHHPLCRFRDTLTGLLSDYRQRAPDEAARLVSEDWWYG